MIVAAAAGGRRRQRAERRAARYRSRGVSEREARARARARRRAADSHVRNLRTVGARDRGLVVRPAWHCFRLHYGHGRRVIEAINYYRCIHMYSGQYDPDAHRLDRGSLLPPDGKNFAFVPWRIDGRTAVQAMPSPWGTLRVKTPTMYPTSLGGHLPQEAFDKLISRLTKWRDFEPSHFVDDLSSSVCFFGKCVCSCARRHRGPGQPKVEALLDELTNIHPEGSESDIGREFAQRGIVVSHLEYRGIHGLCFEILPYKLDGTVNPNWTGPLPALVDVVHQHDSHIQGDIPVAQAIGIQRGSVGQAERASSDSTCSNIESIPASIYAVPVP